MIQLITKNVKEIDAEFRNEFEKICEEKSEFYQDLFKKYDKDLTLEVIVNKSSKTYTVSASLNLISKKVLLAKEDKDVLKATRALFSEFKKAVKRQYELERKDYEYKRKNR